MQYDFSRIDDIDSFVSIPEGRYLCRVVEVREGVSRDGSPRWSVRLEVALGDYAGRTAGWDSLTWSERGIRRVKHALEAFGLDVTGQVEIAPGDLLGREVLATFQSEEREDAFTGRRVLRLRVPYAGYSSSAGATVGTGLAAALGTGLAAALGTGLGAALGTGLGATNGAAAGTTAGSTPGTTAGATAAAGAGGASATHWRNGVRDESREPLRPSAGDGVPDGAVHRGQESEALNGSEATSSGGAPSAASAAGFDDEFED